MTAPLRIAIAGLGTVGYGPITVEASVARSTYKRQSLHIFFFSWCFSYHHNFCIFRAFTGNG